MSNPETTTNVSQQFCFWFPCIADINFPFQSHWSFYLLSLIKMWKRQCYWGITAHLFPRHFAASLTQPREYISAISSGTLSPDCLISLTVPPPSLWSFNILSFHSTTNLLYYPSYLYIKPVIRSTWKFLKHKMLEVLSKSGSLWGETVELSRDFPWFYFNILLYDPKITTQKVLDLLSMSNILQTCRAGHPSSWTSPWQW